MSGNVDSAVAAENGKKSSVSETQTEDENEGQGLVTIVAGSRGIYDRSVVRDAVENASFPVAEVVSGGARGVDQLGEIIALEKGLPVERYEADWENLGDRAGILRNTEMAKYSDALVAIWDGESPGTRHMLQEACRLGLTTDVKLVTDDEETYREAVTFLKDLDREELQHEHLIDQAWDIVTSAFDAGVPYHVVDEHVDLEALEDGVLPSERDLELLAEAAGKEKHWAQMDFSQSQSPKRMEETSREDREESNEVPPANQVLDEERRVREENQERRVEKNGRDRPYNLEAINELQDSNLVPIEEVEVGDDVAVQFENSGRLVKGRVQASTDNWFLLQRKEDQVDCPHSRIEAVEVLESSPLGKELDLEPTEMHWDLFEGLEMLVLTRYGAQEQMDLPPQVHGTVETATDKAVLIDEQWVPKKSIKKLFNPNPVPTADEDVGTGTDGEDASEENPSEDPSSTELTEEEKDIITTDSGGDVGAAETSTAREIGQMSFDPVNGERDEELELLQEAKDVGEEGSFEPLPEFDDGPKIGEFENLEDYAQAVAQEAL